MFSVKGSVVSGNDEKKSVIIRISADDYLKVQTEVKNIEHVFDNPGVQPILPCWEYQGSWYAKVLLSKARREQYQQMLDLVGDNLFNVKVVPYSFNNSNTGQCNGYSLYYQGAFVVPKKFKKTSVQA